MKNELHAITSVEVAQGQRFPSLVWVFFNISAISNKYRVRIIFPVVIREN